MSEAVTRRRVVRTSEPEVAQDQDIRSDRASGLGLALAIALAIVAILTLIALTQGVFNTSGANGSVNIQTNTQVQPSPSTQ